MYALFVVETQSKSHDSDYVYIRSLVDELYGKKHKYDRIYMNGKSNYNRQMNKINRKVKQFHATNKGGIAKVFMCIDIDDFKEPDKKKTNDDLNNDIIKYCKDNEYEFIWFNRDIEDVFWGKQVPDKEKCSMAAKFVSDDRVSSLNTKALEKKNISSMRKCSNIKNVLDKYLR